MAGVAQSSGELFRESSPPSSGFPCSAIYALAYNLHL
jgi:hypothetical protein